MASLLDIVKKGSVDRSVTIRIADSTDGTPETGVVWNTSGIDLWYRREGAAKVSITEASLAALTTAHTDGGFLHISDGEYRLDLPDAAFATGANHVEVGGTVTGMVVFGGRVRLVDYDPEDTVRLGLTALPNAAADAAGGLPISDAGGLDMDAILVDTNSLNDTKIPNTLNTTALGNIGIDWANVENPTSIVDLSATDIQLCDTITTYTGNIVQTGDAFARLGAPAGVSVSADIATIDTVVDGIQTDLSNGTDGLGAIKTDTAAILADTGTDGVVVSADGFTDIWATTTLTEAYATDGSAATPAQLLYMIWSALSDFSISGTTITTKRLDGTTTSMTFTLDDGTNPTSRTRAT